MKIHKMNGKLKNRIWTGSVVAAFVAAISVFLVMLQIEKKSLAEYEKVSVCVAADSIFRGEELTEEQIPVYVEVRELEKTMVPDTAVADPVELTGRVAVCNIERGTVLTEGMLADNVTVTEEMEEPVIAGFRAEDLYQVAGGTLRAGDRIHIYCIDKGEESSTGKRTWENLYVQQVFDQSGNRIPGGDSTTPAQRINIYMDGMQVGEFYSELAKGSLRAVKVCE